MILTRDTLGCCNDCRLYATLSSNNWLCATLGATCGSSDADFNPISCQNVFPGRWATFRQVWPNFDHVFTSITGYSTVDVAVRLLLRWAARGLPARITSPAGAHGRTIVLFSGHPVSTLARSLARLPQSCATLRRPRLPHQWLLQLSSLRLQSCYHRTSARLLSCLLCGPDAATDTVASGAGQ